MSERLIELVNNEVAKSGIEETSRVSGVSVTTLRAIQRRERRPRGRTAFRLAKAFGHTDEEALRLAKECPSARGRKTA